jgi:uncharacterized protein YbjT (DUF2867 family)
MIRQSEVVMKVVMLGATGAVGQEALAELQRMPNIESITALVRRPFTPTASAKLTLHIVDVLKPDTYQDLLAGHDVAICTLGVGEPSKASFDEFKRIDFDGPLDFAKACRAANVKHFELLCSVGANPASSNRYLKSKGALRDAIHALGFVRFSCFQPSMIITPTNRYGASQAVLLAIWPIVSSLLLGPLVKYRGVAVDELGQAIARNLGTTGRGTEILEWPAFQALLR